MFGKHATFVTNQHAVLFKDWGECQRWHSLVLIKGSRVPLALGILVQRPNQTIIGKKSPQSGYLQIMVEPAMGVGKKVSDVQSVDAAISHFPILI